MRFLFLLLFIAAGDLAGGQNAYPAWFYRPTAPNSAVIFADNEDEALLKASQVITAYRATHVMGKFQQFYDQSVDSQTWKNTDYYFEYDNSAANDLEKDLKVQDSFVIELIRGTRLYLVGPKEQAQPESSGSLDWSTIPKPSWSDQLAGVDGSTGRRFGIGRFSLKGNSADAWVTAETMAVFNLLMSKNLSLAHVVQNGKTDGQGAFAKMDWIRLNYEVHDLEVGGRWVDPNTATRSFSSLHPTQQS